MTIFALKPSVAPFDSINQTVEHFIYELCEIKTNNTLLSNALHYHFQAGGSRSRARLTYQISEAFSFTAEECAWLACIPELLHNASLIHDDLQDLGQERRNQPSLWYQYNSDIALCAGDYLISAAYACVAKLNSTHISDLITTIHAHVNDVIKGQINDLSQDKNQSLDDITAYERISAKKSGPLLAMCLTLPLVYSNQKQFVSLANTALEHFAIGYQIHDDIHDIEQDQAKNGIKPGVNIVTILQKRHHLNPILGACNMALSHLDTASQLVSQLPQLSQHIIQAEISKMEKKIRSLRAH